MIPLHNIDLGNKTVFDYRKEYRTKHHYTFMPAQIPLLMTIIVLSILTIRRVLKKPKYNIKENGVPKLRKNGPRTESSNIHSAYTIMIVLFVYVIFLLCGLSNAVVVSFHKNSNFFSFLGFYLTHCGSACNSLIYAVRSSKFRNALKQTFKFIKCQQNQIQPNQKIAGKAFYINDGFGKKVVVVQ